MNYNKIEQQEILHYIKKKSAALAKSTMQKIMGVAYVAGSPRECEMAEKIAYEMTLAYPTYKPGKASVKTFLNKKGELKAKQLCQESFYGKRKGALYECSLDAEPSATAAPSTAPNYCLVVDIRSRLRAIRLNKDLMSLALVLEPELSVEGVKMDLTEARCIVDGWSRATYYRKLQLLAKALLDSLPKKGKAKEQPDKNCKKAKKK